MGRRLLKMSVLLIASAIAGSAQGISGIWNATINVNGVDIPFRMGFSTDGGKVQGWFFNGDDREMSTGGSFSNGSLVVEFGAYAGVLRATVKDGHMDGEYESSRWKLAVHAVPQKFHTQTTDVPNISGHWLIEGVNNSRGEKAWDLVLRQTGSDVSGAILRVDGDTGTLTGSYEGGKFVLSHFDGARPLLLYIAPARDGTLMLTFASQRGAPGFTAYPEGMAAARDMPKPTDPDAYTTMKDAGQPFPFRFPDLSGRKVANTDERFRNKVVLIDITGSWCPNCHDEAPFLVELYKKYRARGLEIVGLSFEEADQMADPVGLKAFVAQYGIDYPILFAGQTETAKEKLAAAVNWGSFPTTFFVGRDGLVKYVHSGYAGAGTGELAKRERQAFTDRIEKLLAEKPAAKR